MENYCKCHCHGEQDEKLASQGILCRCIKNCIHCHPENFKPIKIEVWQYRLKERFYTDNVETDRITGWLGRINDDKSHSIARIKDIEDFVSNEIKMAQIDMAREILNIGFVKYVYGPQYSSAEMRDGAVQIMYHPESIPLEAIINYFKSKGIMP